MTCINRRWTLNTDLTEIERGFQASIHGAKYTPRIQSNADTKEVEEISKDTDDLARRHIEKRMTEMRARAATK